MRESVETLRRESEAIRGILNNAITANEDYRHKWEEIAGRVDRAADLLEALSNPPETVEELRERAEALLGEDFVAVDESTGMALDARVVTGMVQGMGTGGLVSVSAFDPRVPSIEVRAAWFAIVGMMEVGRG